MTTTTTDLNQLGEEMLAYSRRWFPNLHATTTGGAVHFALGLAGEVGELGEAWGPAASTWRSDVLSAELADVAIYALDLGAVLKLDVQSAADTLVRARTTLDRFGPLGVGAHRHRIDWTTLAITAGLICNLVKKLNRGDDTDLRKLTHEVARLLLDTAELGATIGVDLGAAIAAKVAVCEARWGTR